LAYHVMLADDAGTMLMERPVIPGHENVTFDSGTRMGFKVPPFDFVLSAREQGPVLDYVLAHGAPRMPPRALPQACTRQPHSSMTSSGEFVATYRSVHHMPDTIEPHRPGLRERSRARRPFNGSFPLPRAAAIA